jgi:hypothetical protein
MGDWVQSIRTILSKLQTSSMKSATRWYRDPLLLIVIILTLLLCARIIFKGILTYGDIPLFDVDLSKVNPLYVWGGEQLGTNVRQGFNTIRDSGLQLLAQNNGIFYFLKYILPMLLIPVTYYLLLRRLHIRNAFVLIFGALFPLFTPIVFGDFLGGQTFWIYLTIPWIFYYAITVFCLEKFSFRNYVIIGLLLFLNLGMLPPIIAPLLITLSVFIGTVFIINIPNLNMTMVKKYIGAGLVIGLTFGLLAMPYILAGSSGQQAYSPSSLLGDYFHNYASTDLVNTLRLSGNNGSGQTTLGYNIFSLSNAVGYMMIMVVAIGALLLISEKNHHRDAARTIVIATLATTLSILGFMHLMADSQTFGIKVFQSQWIVSTIRNPAKLYVLLLPLFTILLSVSLTAFLAKCKDFNLKIIIAATAILALMTYGWPTLRGDFGLLVGNNKAVANYKPDPIMQRINKELRIDPEARSILIPANHSDELNYEKLSPGLKTLGLQGSLPDTAKVISQTNRTLNAQNNYFFNYINAIGIRNIFVKNNPKYYEKIPFSLFSVNTSPATVNNFLGKYLTAKSKDNDYSHYINESGSDKLFAAQNIINIRNDDELISKAAFMSRNTAVISHAESSQLAVADSYDVLKRPPNDTGAEGKVQLHDPNLLLGDLYTQKQAGKVSARLDILNPLNGSVDKSYDFDITPDTTVATINGQNYIFNSNKKRVSVRSSTQQIVFSSLESVSTRNLDASFEENQQASDGEKGKPGSAEIYSGQSNDKTDGQRSLQLGTSNHIAFIEKELPTLQENSEYLISFDYKNISGQGPRYSVINQVQRYDAALSSGRLDPVSNWTTNDIFIKLDELTKLQKGKHRSSLYLYTDTKKGQKSENLFDNMRISKLRQTSTHELITNSYEPDYDLKDYPAAFKTPERNLLDNSSFEEKSLWGKPQDATPGLNGNADISSRQSDDSVDGKHSLELTSSNHTAYVTRQISSYKPNTIYKVAFNYKNISGAAPSFAVWQSGAQLSSPRADLKSQKDWTYFETFFIPDQETVNLSLYLYSSSRGEKTVNLFDNVTITEASAISQYLVKSGSASEKPRSFLASYTQDSPVKITSSITEGKGMLVWNESFSKGWKAFIAQKDGTSRVIEESDHLKVNGFANGWWIDTASFGTQAKHQDKAYTITLRYMPQESFNHYLLISLISLAVIVAYLSSSIRNKRLSSRKPKDR